MNKVAGAHISLIGANLIYGINYIVAKGLLPDHMTPFALIMSRILGALILFWVLGLFGKSEKIEKKDFIRLIIASLFGIALNQSLFINGLNFTSSIDASILMTSNPILVMVIAAIVLREPITSRKVFGIVSGATGALLLLFYSGKVDFSSNHFLGNIMIFANALSYAVYLVVVKPIMLKYSPVTVMKWVFLFGLCFVFPFGIQDFIAIDWGDMPKNILLGVLYVVVATTFLAYLLNIYALKYVKPTTVSIYIYFQPVIAAALATFLGTDTLTLIKIISTLLVFNGVYFVSRAKKFN